MINELFAALAEDLAQLIRLHDRELDAGTLAALRTTAFPSGLALPPTGEAAEAAYANLAVALAESDSLDALDALDELAADYAAIYLNNSLGASPYESVWLSDDHLACASPMFELRELYAAAGLQAANWRCRFDDHLVLQLQYLRHQLGAPTVDAGELANFIDEHIGYWFPDFAQRVAQAFATPFYAALMEVTLVWLMRLRALLDEAFALPVPDRATMTARIGRKLALDKAEVAPVRFMPGAQGPSW